MELPTGAPPELSLQMRRVRAGAVLPLLAAKQRVTARADWMTTDAEVACPDPNCASRLRIIRTGLRRFRHSETTVVPMSAAKGNS